MAKKRVNFLTFQAEGPLCHLEHFCFSIKSNGIISKATLDMNRAIFRNCFKSFVINGKSPLINPENLSLLSLNKTAKEVSQISGFF